MLASAPFAAAAAAAIANHMVTEFDVIVQDFTTSTNKLTDPLGPDYNNTLSAAAKIDIHSICIGPANAGTIFYSSLVPSSLVPSGGPSLQIAVGDAWLLP